MRNRRFFAAALLAAVILVLPAAAGCQTGTPPPPLETTSLPTSSEPSQIFSHEYLIREQAGSPDELEPGLYCLSAAEGKGLFRLVTDEGERERLIREQAFKSYAWVEVRAGERLKVAGADLVTREEREEQLCYPVRRGDGFFLIGIDLFPGVLAVQASSQPDAEGPVCEVYTTAHDLSGGPVRSYEFGYSLINIEVEEGEFLLLKNAEAYVPPS